MTIWLVQRTEKHERPITVAASNCVLKAEKCAALIEGCKTLYIYTRGKDNSLPEKFKYLLDGHYSFYDGVTFTIKEVAECK